MMCVKMFFKNVEVLPKPPGPIGRHWSPFPQPSARHQLMLRDHGYMASASHSVLVYVTDFADTELYCLVRGI